MDTDAEIRQSVKTMYALIKLGCCKNSLVLEKSATLTNWRRKIIEESQWMHNKQFGKFIPFHKRSSYQIGNKKVLPYPD